MKKRIRMISIALLSLSLCACGQKANPQTAAAEPAEKAEAAEESEENVAGAGENTSSASETAALDTQQETDQVVHEDLGIPAPSNRGALSVIDGKLCDEHGESVQLKGVSTHAVTRTEMQLNQELFEEMRYDWGVNVVRLAMYVVGQDGYTKSDYFREKNIELIQKGVELATSQDQYVIIDWHILDDGNPLENKDSAIEFFDLISAEYADHSNVIYEICNEPNGVEWSDVKAYAEEVIPVIRKNAPESVILVGTPDWSQGVDQALAAPLDFENLMYSLHFYSASHKDDLRNRMIECTEAGLPIFVTEYGVTASSGGFPRDLDEADLWMEAMDKYGISSCIWNMTKNGEACCLISSACIKTSGYETEDFTETGAWFRDMLDQYIGR